MTDEIDRTLPDGTVFMDKPKLRYPEEIYAERIAALIAAGDKLAWFAGHEDDCASSMAWADPAPCDCGHHEAWAAWQALTGKAEQ